MADNNTRDHLANERTFLAWVRTSIALISFGVVIAKLRFLGLEAPGATPPHAGAHSTALGLAFCGVGLCVLIGSAFHYDRTRRAIESGDYRAAALALFLFVALLFLLGLASIVYLVTLSPH